MTGWLCGHGGGPRPPPDRRAGLRLREISELLQVADRGHCPCGHTGTLLRQRLAEVRAELDCLRALEADLAPATDAPGRPGLPRDGRRDRLVVRH